jgi:outer membrane protein TolC
MSSYFFAPSPGRIRGRGLGAALVHAALASAIAIYALPSAAQAPLTLGQAQRLALERSRQIAAHDFATMASREMAVAAGQLPDPTLKLGVDNLPVEGPDRFSIGRDFMTMRRVGVMQELTRSEKLRLRAQRFELEAEKSLAERAATAATIQRDTAVAWLDRYYADAMSGVIAQQASEERLEIEAAESAYRAGRGSQADIFTARAALVSLEDRASEFTRRIRTAKTALARWIGDDADRPLSGKPDIDSIRLHAHALEADIAHHPEIESLAKQEEIAATEAKLAQANKKADWSVELMYNVRGSAFSNMVSIGVSVPLQWDQRNRQDRELAAKLAMAAQAGAQREDMLRAHVAETRAMVAEWESLRERKRRHEAQLIPLSSERTQAVLASYRGGKASLSDVLAARRNEVETRMQTLQLEMDAARLWAQLNYLVPDDFREVGGHNAGAENATKEMK